MFEARLTQGSLLKKARRSRRRFACFLLCSCRPACPACCSRTRAPPPATPCIASRHTQVLDSIKELVTDANFDCAPTGFSLQAMDSSHVSLVALLLRADGFEHYRCDRPISMGMNLANMVRLAGPRAERQWHTSAPRGQRLCPVSRSPVRLAACPATCGWRATPGAATRGGCAPQQAAADTAAFAAFGGALSGQNAEVRGKRRRDHHEG